MMIPGSPDFIKLVSNDIRWQLLKALSSSDLKVQELVQRVGQPQNLVSYHLHLLSDQALVTEHRSKADGRSIYYSLNLDRLKDFYVSSGEALHPALVIRESFEQKPSLPRQRVLFLCTNNSARSQMAEGILKFRSAGQVETFSAGTEPSEVHPLAVQAMAEMNIDIRNHRSKSVTEFLGQEFDWIITVCDRARESCPVFPGDPVRVHWSFPDPANFPGSENERYHQFRVTALQMNTRIGYLLMMFQRSQG